LDIDILDYINSLHLEDFDWRELPDYILDSLTEEELEEVKTLYPVFEKGNE
jgi:hypothetical protein